MQLPGLWLQINITGACCKDKTAIVMLPAGSVQAYHDIFCLQDRQQSIYSSEANANMTMFGHRCVKTLIHLENLGVCPKGKQ